MNAGDLSLDIVSNGIMREEKLDEEDEMGMSWMLVSLSTLSMILDCALMGEPREA